MFTDDEFCFFFSKMSLNKNEISKFKEIFPKLEQYYKEVSKYYNNK